MKSTITIFLFMLLCSCGLGSITPKPHSEELISLEEIEEDILNHLPEKVDQHGWINTDRCDALIFNGILHSLVGNIDLLLAKDQETGKWYRTPFKDCYRNYKSQREHTRKSKSECSRDGYVGLLWAFSSDASLGRKESKSILRYGRRNNWIMCDGDKDTIISRRLLTPNMQRSFALFADEVEPSLPDVWVYPVSQSDRHLVVLHILVRGKIVGEITADMFSVIEQAFKDEPNNAFFSFAYHNYTDGDQSHTVSLIKKLYPNTTCKTWLWIEPERKWMDCDQSNSNAEFLLVIRLLRESHVTNT